MVCRLVVCCLVLLSRVAVAEHLPRIGTVVAVEGSVTVQRHSGDKTVRAGDVLYAGDVVSTDAGETVELRLNDHATFFVRERSRLRLVAFVHAVQGTPTPAPAQAALEKGKMIVRTGSEPVVVATPTAVVKGSNARFAVEVK